jgi:uncharacterized protein YndB with AHSA1/START domain
MPVLDAAPTSSSAPVLELTRVIHAPRARVFEAWTRPELLQQWFGPAGMHCPNAASRCGDRSE